ncbi:MAG: beta-ketoacyl-[acyl-carrier-protein] synthase family protein [Rhodospirillales bacterium]|nr:beta-ketoacyl-[acyl-carrier-protein] synthase family protein [Rhodospirillales bacterium]
MHRVAITGLGCISALGLDVASTWAGLKAGRSGIKPLTQVGGERLTVKIAGQVEGFDPLQQLGERVVDFTDLCAQYAIVVGREAFADSGLELDAKAARRTACLIGTGMGGMRTLDEGFDRLYWQRTLRPPPLTVPKVMPSAAASQVSMALGLTGPTFGVTSACSSSNHAIGEALWMIRSGRVDRALAGGSEACLSYGCLKAWEVLRVMAPDTCRPFSRDRKGMVIGEGAGVVVLENWELARARGARIYAELAGCGFAADAADLVQPSPDGAAAALTDCLEDAGLKPEEIGYVNAHGTATRINDRVESQAIRQVFGAQADRLAISSSKSMLGHGLGAAGGLEIIPTVMAVVDGVLPPTANYNEPDPACDLDYVPNQPRVQEVEAALSNSFAFGGLNAILAVRRAEL